MADFDNDHDARPGHYHDDGHPHTHREERRRSNWPIWLLVPLGIFGLVAVSQMGDRDDQASRSAAQERPASTTLTYNGQTLSNAGSAEVQFADEDMEQAGTSQDGVILYRHKTQPWSGGGGGQAGPSTTNPLYMKTGHDTYLPFKPIGPAGK
jgi:hypothetical protein